MKGQILKGHLDFLLLGALASGPAHGYAVAERLRTRSGGALDLPEGTLYPALHRLERSGVLVSKWSEVNGRRRRMYQLTAKGQRALATQRQEWTAFRQVVDGVIGG
jgi:PadR family transcriptional regulator, regulatory protein PadR